MSGPQNTSRVGYARRMEPISTANDSLFRLQRAGCEKIFVDRAPAAGRRPELTRALAAVHNTSVFVVVSLHELGRSMKHLVSVIVELADRGVGFISLDDGIDTTEVGDPSVDIFRILNKYEAALLSERTTQGLTSARAHGRLIGRPRLLDTDRLRLAETMYASGRYTAAEIARTFNISRATLYRNIAEFRSSDPRVHRRPRNTPDQASGRSQVRPEEYDDPEK